MKAAEKIFKTPKIYRFKIEFFKAIFSFFTTYVTKRNWEVYKVAKKYIKDSVLDVGCGPGNNSKDFFRIAPNIRYVGFDPEAKMIKHAKEKYANSKTKFFVSEAHKLPYKDNEFSVGYLNGVFHHIEKAKQRKSLKEIVRVCKYVIINDMVNFNSTLGHALKNSWWKTADGGEFYPSLKQWHEIFKELNLKVVEEFISRPVSHFYLVVLEKC